MTIDFWYRDDDIDADDDIYLQLYNGSAYANRLELDSSSEDTWQHATVTINNSGGDAAYFISNFRIKFEGTSIDSGENLWIDDVVVTGIEGFSGAGGYELASQTLNYQDTATQPAITLAGEDHIVFDGAYQNGWAGTGTTSFGGETVINAATTGGWGWIQSSASAAKDLSALAYYEYQVYFVNTGGNEVQWHVVAPQGYEWDGAYEFRTDCSIDGTPRTLPYNVSFDTWHTIAVRHERQNMVGSR